MGKWSSSPSDLEKGPHNKGRPSLPPPNVFPPTPKPWFPWLVPLIFVANIAMFIYSMYLNDCPSHTRKDRCLFYHDLKRFSFQPFHENPLLGPSTTALKKLGALDWKLVVEYGQGWRLLSCMWLHAGVFHLLANMVSLLFIGIRLEQEFGFFRIGLLYVLSGFGGSLLSTMNLNPSRPIISVGASGALFGLLGAMLSELITNWTIYANKCAALFSLMIVIVLNLAFGLLPNVDNSAHIGGFIAGFLLGFILMMRPQYGYVNPQHIPSGYDIKRKPRHTIYQYVFWIFAFLALLFGYAYCLLKLFNGEARKKYSFVEHL